MLKHNDSVMHFAVIQVEEKQLIAKSTINSTFNNLTFNIQVLSWQKKWKNLDNK